MEQKRIVPFNKRDDSRLVSAGTVHGKSFGSFVFVSIEFAGVFIVALTLNTPSRSVSH